MPRRILIGRALLRLALCAAAGHAVAALERPSAPPRPLHAASPNSGRFNEATSIAVWSGPRLAYARDCAGCHLLTGAGIPGQVPALRGFVGYFMRSSAGRAYVPRVPGVADSPLSDRELAALLNWVLRKFSAPELPAGFAPYTSEEVRALRARPLTAIAAERAQALRGLIAAHELPAAALPATASRVALKRGG